jgi:hypothetical protein
VISGRVVLRDSVTAGAGVAITVLDTTGRVASRGTSNREGLFSLAIGQPGDFILEILRIGFLPWRSPVKNLSPGERRTVDVVLVAVPVDLPAVSVDDRNTCDRIAPGKRDVIPRVWQLATSALSAPRLKEASAGMDAGGNFDIHYFQIDGSEDRPANKVGGVEVAGRNRHRDMDSTKARELYTRHFFATTPAETLLTRGYVRRRSDGGVHFDAPSGRDLVSEEFLATHCLSVDESRDHPGWIGIRFRPMKQMDTIANISGTLWLSGDTTRLRMLEFSYTSLPMPQATVCDDQGRRCLLQTAEPESTAGTGGSLSFDYARTGEWFVSHWEVRSPSGTYQVRRSAVKERVGRRGPEGCITGRDCEPLNVPVPRLSVTAGAVIDITHDEKVVYQDKGMLEAFARLAKRQSGKTEAHVAGVVTDTKGKPLSRVTISVDSPARSAITNAAGVFEIRTLPAKQIGLLVRKEGFESLSFRIPLFADSTRHIRLTLIPSDRR